MISVLSTRWWTPTKQTQFRLTPIPARAIPLTFGRRRANARHANLNLMQLSDLFLGLGQDTFPHLLRGISMGKLRTFQLFDRVKTRFHLAKLNQESLRKAAPRLWTRIEAREEELASDLSQAILISHMDLIVAVLNFLGVPHTDGFFEKDAQLAEKLSGDWQQRAYDQWKSAYPEHILVFYLNHLAREVNPEGAIFKPAGQPAGVGG